MTLITPTSGRWGYGRSIAQHVPPEILERFRLQERYDCWNRDEFDLMQEPYADDALFDVSAVFTDIAPIRGRQDMLRYWRELRHTWEGLRMDPLDVLDAGNGRFVVEVRLWGKGQRSGVEVDQRFAFVYTFRPDDEKVISAQLLPDVATALTVAESSASQAA